jgi:YgiT-type zinc finger domain-containing protein
MICEFCGGHTRKKKVKRQHWFQSCLYIVENVEAEVCDECGERYFHAVTLDAIDHYLLAAHEVKKRITVELVDMAA